MESIAPIVEAAVPGAGPVSAPGGLAKRLSELQLLNSRDLRTEWRRLFRSNPPNLSRDLLVRAIFQPRQNRVRRVYSHRLRGAVYGPVSDAADRVRSAPRDRRRARLKRYPGWGAAIRSVGEQLVARARLRQEKAEPEDCP